LIGKADVVIGAGRLDQTPLSTAREAAIEPFSRQYRATAIHVRSTTDDSTPHP
jgi:hypothetical protein